MARRQFENWRTCASGDFQPNAGSIYKMSSVFTTNMCTFFRELGREIIPDNLYIAGGSSLIIDGNERRAIITAPTFPRLASAGQVSTFERSSLPEILELLNLAHGYSTGKRCSRSHGVIRPSFARMNPNNFLSYSEISFPLADDFVKDPGLVFVLDNSDPSNVGRLYTTLSQHCGSSFSGAKKYLDGTFLNHGQDGSLFVGKGGMQVLIEKRIFIFASTIHYFRADEFMSVSINDPKIFIHAVTNSHETESCATNNISTISAFKVPAINTFLLFGKTSYAIIPAWDKTNLRIAIDPNDGPLRPLARLRSDHDQARHMVVPISEISAMLPEKLVNLMKISSSNLVIGGKIAAKYVADKLQLTTSATAAMLDSIGMADIDVHVFTCSSIIMSIIMKDFDRILPVSDNSVGSNGFEVTAKMHVIHKMSGLTVKFIINDVSSGYGPKAAFHPPLAVANCASYSSISSTIHYCGDFFVTCHGISDLRETILSRPAGQISRKTFKSNFYVSDHLFGATASASPVPDLARSPIAPTRSIFETGTTTPVSEFIFANKDSLNRDELWCGEIQASMDMSYFGLANVTIRSKEAKGMTVYLYNCTNVRMVGNFTTIYARESSLVFDDAFVSAGSFAKTSTVFISGKVGFGEFDIETNPAPYWCLSRNLPTEHLGFVKNRASENVHVYMSNS